MTHKTLKQIAKGTLQFSFATLLSRILGFLRDIIIAFTLGAGPLADAFFVAFRIPNLLRRLFGEGSLSMAFVPIFVSIKQKKGIEEAYTFSRSVFFWLFLILTTLTLMAFLFAKHICMVVAPGFSSSYLMDYTARLLRICFPYIIFISAVAMCMGILNSMNHYLVPALSPCILNLCLISFALTGFYLKLSVPLTLSFGVLTAGVLQFLMQQPVLFRLGFRWRGRLKLKDERLKELLKLMGPSVFGAAVYQITILINTILASFLPRGSISYLYYADRFVQFPLGIFGVAIGMASLPNLSELVVKKKLKDFKEVFNRSLHLNLFISIPATAGLISLGYPIIDFFLKRGAFNEYDVKATTCALIGYSIGLPAYCLMRTVLSAYYSFKDTLTPVKVGIISLFFNIALAIGLMKKYSFLGLALASALSSWLNLIILAFFFKKKVAGGFKLQGELIWILLISGAMSAGCYYSYIFLKNLSLLTLPFWIIFYLTLSHVLKIQSWNFLKAGLSLRKKTTTKSNDR